MTAPKLPNLISALRLLGRPIKCPDWWLEVAVRGCWSISIKDGDDRINLAQMPPKVPNFRVQARGEERFYDHLEAAVADVRELLGMNLEATKE